MNRLRQNAATYLIYQLFFIVMFFPVVFGGKSFIHRDIASYYYPMWHTVVSMVKNGVLPLWNPFNNFGAPCLGNLQACVFYPASFLLYLGDYTRCFNGYILFHLALASFFTYLWVRELKTSWPAAFLSGLVFGTGGYVMSVVCLTSSLSSAVYLPLALLTFRRSLLCPGPRWKFATALVLLCQYLAGEPGILVMTVGVLFLGAVCECCRRIQSPRIRWAPLKEWALILLMFAGLSAFQSFLFLELLAHSERAHLALADKLQWSMPLSEWGNILVPSVNDMNVFFTDYWHRQSWLANAYLGISAVFLAVVSFMRCRDSRVFAHAGLFALGILLAMGKYSAVYLGLIKIVPFMTFIRYPVRFFLLSAFALACLSGLGFDAVIGHEGLKRPERRKGWLIFFIVAAFTAMGLALAFCSVPVMRNMVIIISDALNASRLEGVMDGNSLATLCGIVVNMRRTFFFLSLVAAACLAGVFTRTRRPLVVFFVAAVTFLDLSGNIRQVTADSVFMKEGGSNLSYLKKEKGLFRVMASPKAMEEAYRVLPVSSGELLRRNQELLAPNYPLLHGLYDAFGYDSVWLDLPLRWWQALQTLDVSSCYRAFDALNIKFIASPKTRIGPGHEGVHASSYATLFASKAVMPRAYLVGRAVKETDLDAIVHRAAERAFDPLQTVYVDWDVPPDAGVDPSGGPGDVQITRYTPNEVEMRVTVESRPWLFFSDTYYPGWKVWVDGKRERIIKADAAFRALRLARGGHVVVWRYDPLLFKIGVGVSLLTLAICVVVCRKERAG